MTYPPFRSAGEGLSAGVRLAARRISINPTKHFFFKLDLLRFLYSQKKCALYHLITIKNPDLVTKAQVRDGFLGQTGSGLVSSGLSLSPEQAEGSFE
jgi:hypothetical protein